MINRRQHSRRLSPNTYRYATTNPAASFDSQVDTAQIIGGSHGGFALVKHGVIPRSPQLHQRRFLRRRLLHAAQISKIVGTCFTFRLQLDGQTLKEASKRSNVLSSWNQTGQIVVFSYQLWRQWTDIGFSPSVTWKYHMWQFKIVQQLPDRLCTTRSTLLPMVQGGLDSRAVLWPDGWPGIVSVAWTKAGIKRLRFATWTTLSK